MFIAVVPDYAEHPSKIFLVRENYLNAIIAGGGLPIVVPYEPTTIKSYLDKCTGLLIIGGGFTINPNLFGETNQNSLPIKEYRTNTELTFFHEAFNKKMPILGICGGAQLINVALGGTLIQHLPTSHPNTAHQDGTNDHPITIKSDTLLSGIFEQAEEIVVNTSHVQAINRLGKNVIVNASAHDGIIEGIEVTDHPFCLGVQWHPEYHKNTYYDPLIFKYFMGHAKNYTRNKLSL